VDRPGIPPASSLPPGLRACAEVSLLPATKANAKYAHSSGCATCHALVLPAPMGSHRHITLDLKGTAQARSTHPPRAENDHVALVYIGVRQRQAQRGGATDHLAGGVILAACESGEQIRAMQPSTSPWIPLALRSFTSLPRAKSVCAPIVSVAAI
jgi:hypothetical protein